MLQSLYGYTATDAGLVLGPGAMVMMVRLLPKVGVKPMIAVGYFVFALSMWYYASLDLGTDYKHEALARALQGLGIAPLFIIAQARNACLAPHDRIARRLVSRPSPGVRVFELRQRDRA